MADEWYPDDEHYATPGAVAIALERARQIHEEGWTDEHDDVKTRGQLADAAVCYADWATHGRFDRGRWPWNLRWWKPSMDDYPVRDLVKAGALIAAEIDRLLRASDHEDVKAYEVEKED